MQQEVMEGKIIFTYISFPIDGDQETYWIYDPETNKHYEVSKAKYDEVMKNVSK
jgi:hypothetical protein